MFELEEWPGVPYDTTLVKIVSDYVTLEIKRVGEGINIEIHKWDDKGCLYILLPEKNAVELLETALKAIQTLT